MAYRPLTDIPLSLFGNSSTMLTGGVLRAYVTGTSTPATLYSDADGASAGTSVTLDARGEPTTIKRIWLDTAVTYKLTLEDADGNVLWTADPIYGTWPADELSVTSYGAVGDGVADDAAAIQAAITAATSGSKAKKVVFPDGIYRIGTSLLVTSACVLEGQGSPGPRVYANPATKYGGAEIVFDRSVTTVTDPDSFAIKIDAGSIGAEGNAQVEVRNLGISWTDVDAGGVYVEGSARVKLNNLWLCGGKTAADADTLRGIGIYCRNMISSDIDGVVFNYVAYGVIGDDYFNENAITNCDFGYITRLPIGIYSVTNTSIRNSIYRNNFIGNGSTPPNNAIQLSGDVQQTDIYDNTFEIIDQNSIIANQLNPLTGAALSGSPKGVSVHDNTFIACGGGLAGSVCLAVSAGTHFWFYHNTIKSPSAPMGALVNTFGSAGPVFIGPNDKSTVAEWWSGTPPTTLATNLYQQLPRDTSESEQSGWDSDNFGAIWGNANVYSLRMWNGTRSVSLKTAAQTTDNTSNATPNVRGCSVILLNPGAPYTITNFLQGTIGQTLIVYNQSAHTITIDCTGTNLVSLTGANYSLGTSPRYCKFENIDGNTWVQII